MRAVYLSHSDFGFALKLMKQRQFALTGRWSERLAEETGGVITHVRSRKSFMRQDPNFPRRLDSEYFILALVYMWIRRQPCMQMVMHDQRLKQPEIVDRSDEARSFSSPLPRATAQASPRLAHAPMFSHNMSHLRGAKPCGSCGGR